MRTSLLALALLPACGGPITNLRFAEDADFLAVLPTAERQTIHYAPGDTRRIPVALPAGSPDLRSWTARITADVNAAVLDVLDLVALVRSHPPTARTDDGRTWGPWEVEDETWLVVDIVRSGLGQYDWTFSLSEAPGGPWVVGLGGTHWAGTTVAGGDGDFDAHVGTIAGFLGGAAAGEVAVDYDNREGIDLVVVFERFRGEGGGDLLDATYDYREDPLGNGDFQFATDADVAEGAALEHVAARSRWTAGGELRADARVDGGDLGELAVTLAQCWDETGALVHQADDAGLFEQVGSTEDCAFPEPSLPGDGEEG